MDTGQRVWEITNLENLWVSDPGQGKKKGVLQATVGKFRALQWKLNLEGAWAPSQPLTLWSWVGLEGTCSIYEEPADKICLKETLLRQRRVSHLIQGVFTSFCPTSAQIQFGNPKAKWISCLSNIKMLIEVGPWCLLTFVHQMLTEIFLSNEQFFPGSSDF